jgi:hypothetical protein
MPEQEQYYTIPQKFRKIENLHIVFWLIKDLSWVMLWKPLGLAMIVPTIGAALLITWQTRHLKSELMHNLAVVCWIIANGYWMITEFISTNEALRYYAIIPFSVGLFIIAWYYVVIGPKQKRAVMATDANVVVLAPK